MPVHEMRTHRDPKCSSTTCHVGRLTEDAHVGQDAVIHQVVRAVSIATIFFALEIAPLRFFDFARNGSDDHVALQPHTSALQGLHGMGVADQRAFHVVNAEAVDESVLYDRVRLVAETGEKILVARV